MKRKQRKAIKYEGKQYEKFEENDGGFVRSGAGGDEFCRFLMYDYLKSRGFKEVYARGLEFFDVAVDALKNG